MFIITTGLEATSILEITVSIQEDPFTFKLSDITMNGDQIGHYISSGSRVGAEGAMPPPRRPYKNKS